VKCAFRDWGGEGRKPDAVVLLLRSRDDALGWSGVAGRAWHTLSESQSEFFSSFL